MPNTLEINSELLLSRYQINSNAFFEPSISPAEKVIVDFILTMLSDIASNLSQVDKIEMRASDMNRNLFESEKNKISLLLHFARVSESAMIGVMDVLKLYNGDRELRKMMEGSTKIQSDLARISVKRD